MSYRLYFTRQSLKDAKKLKKSGFDITAKRVLDILSKNPYTLPYEKLIGDLKGCYSRRINIQHRIVYQIDEHTKDIKVLRMWTHYE